MVQKRKNLSIGVSCNVLRSIPMFDQISTVLSCHLHQHYYLPAQSPQKRQEAAKPVADLQLQTMSLQATTHN